MSYATKTSTEVQGYEYDWLGCDSTGHIALFCTAGAGYAPVAFLDDTDAHYVAAQSILGLPPTTEARFFPSIASGLVNTWRAAAERGLYAYDCDPTGGPYRLVAAPEIAATVDEFPDDIAIVARKIRCTGAFAQLTIVTEAMLHDT